MNSLLPDALADALGQVVADLQRQWRKDVEHITADARVVIAEFRADVLALHAELKMAAEREMSRIPDALASVKDGAPGERGADGKSADPAVISEMVAAEVAEALEAIRRASGSEPKRGINGADGATGPVGPAGIDGATGPVGPQGDPGLDGAKGADGADGHPGRDGRDGLPGVQGEKGLDGMNGKDGGNGKDGRDGIDGLGFDDMSAEHDGDRTVTLRFVRGDQVKEFPLSFAVPLDRGVYRSSAKYQKGDSVTCGGSLWIAQRDTSEKPEAGKDWRLAVKRGRDGKDGKAGERGLPGIEGKAGRDLTQIGPDGARW